MGNHDRLAEWMPTFGCRGSDEEKGPVGLFEALELNLYLLERNDMTKIDDVFGGQHLKASDLQGRTVPVTIESFEVVDFDDGKKVVISFVGKEKSLVCNKTNARTIGDQCGEHLEEWVGKTISLFPTQTDFQGKQVACIRVVIPQNPVQTANVQPETGPKPAHEPILDADSVPF